MDKVAQYQSIIKNVLQKHAAGREPQMDEYETQVVMDDVHGHYFLLGVGWKRYERILGTTLHIDLKKDKVWIQQDWTEPGIALELEELGIPKSDIVLAFHAPYRRKLIEEYAAA